MQLSLLIAVGVLSIFHLGAASFRVGGKSSKDFDNLDNQIKEIVFGSLEAATLKFNQQTNNYLLHSVFDLKNLQTQVVAGLKLYFDVILVGTKCVNNKNNWGKSLEACGLNGNSPPQECQVEVWSQVWLNKTETTIKKCQPAANLNIHSNLHFILGTEEHAIGTMAQFDQFLKENNKFYEDAGERNLRFKIFHANMKRAFLLSITEQGSASYGATEFADLTEGEFRRSHLAPKWDVNKAPKKFAPLVSTKDVPTSFDWRTKGAVTEVKNQGQCGSCWAFSTTGNIEGQWFLKKNQLISLSEQQLVDCDKVDQGCNGGLPSDAYKQIISWGGLESEADYPYTGADGACKSAPSKYKIYINDSLAISKDEGQMAAWLAANGSISIGINAAAMQFYFGGISHPWKMFCNPANLDHGVLIVGYGVEGTKPYWIIKNSWGPTWGEKGYYLVYRGDGVCGLNTMCTSAVIH